ncbi:MAG: flagellar biosynthetic protein FliO [Pseudomonadota bacterium]
MDSTRKKYLAALAAALLVLLAPAAASCAMGESEPSLLGAVFKMLAALAICLGLLIGGAHLLRRFKLVDAVRGDAAIKILSSRSLGPKRCISLVEVGGELLVIGVADGGVSLLTKLSPQTPRSSHGPRLVRGLEGDRDAGEEGLM